MKPKSFSYLKSQTEINFNERFIVTLNEWSFMFFFYLNQFNILYVNILCVYS